MAAEQENEQYPLHEQIHNQLIHLGYMWSILDKLRRSISSVGEIPTIYHGLITESEFPDQGIEKMLVEAILEIFSSGHKTIFGYYDKAYKYLDSYLRNYFRINPEENWTVTGHNELGKQMSLKGKPSGLKSGTNNTPCLAFSDTEQIFPLTCLEDIRFGTHLVRMPQVDWLEKTSDQN